RRVSVPLEDRDERELQVVERLVGEVVTRGETADDQPRHPVEGALVRDAELDSLSHGPSAPCSSSSAISCSRRAAALRAASLACRGSPETRKAAMPCETPSNSPESFCTGRVMASDTARTAVSTLSAASTALSVTRSTSSS